MKQGRRSEQKATRFDVKGLKEDGSFEGYASLFGAEDLGRDVVMPGAFRSSLAKRGPRGIKMLYQHDPNEVIGVWLKLSEDIRGLRVEGKLLPDVGRSREVLSLMRAGAVDGLSIGYHVVKATKDGEDGTSQADRSRSLGNFGRDLSDAARGAHQRRQIGTSDGTAIRTLALAGCGVQPGGGSPHRGGRLQGASSFAGREGRRWRGAGAGIPRGGAHFQLTLEGSMMNAFETGVPRIGASLKGEARAPEVKSVGAHEVRDAMDEFLSAFDDFKQANDERLDEIEKKLSADVVTEEKVDRINRALDRQKKTVDELALTLARPEIGGEPPRAARPGAARAQARLRPLCPQGRGA